MHIATLSPSAHSSAQDDRSTAQLILARSLLLGFITQVLFFEAAIGLNFYLWVMVSIGAMVSSFRRQPLSPVAWGTVAAAGLLAFSVVLRASVWTLVIAVPTTIVLLSFLPILISSNIQFDDIARLPKLANLTFRHGRSSLQSAGKIHSQVFGDERSPVISSVTRGLVIGLPLSFIFAVLLSADASFRRALEWLFSYFGDATSFVFCSVVSAIAILLFYAFHQTKKPTEVATESWVEEPYRTPAPPIDSQNNNSQTARWNINPTTWAIVIWNITVVFAVFAAVNIRTLFGGESLIRTEAGLTYASHLHSGFIQLICATALSVCLVLSGHKILNHGHSSSAIPGGKALSIAESSLLVLTSVALASSWQRLAIYFAAYGMTLLRLGVAVIQLFLLGVIFLTIVKSVSRRWTSYGSCVTTFAVGITIVSSLTNVEGYVATKNLAGDESKIDYDYIGSLSVDASVVLAHPHITSTPWRLEYLKRRLCTPQEHTDPRSFRGLGRFANCD